MKKIIHVFSTLAMVGFMASCSSSPKIETGLYQMEKEDSNKLEIRELGENIMPISTYVSPTPEHGDGFDRIPSQINDKYYALAKEAGVNVIYGHNETGDDILKNLDLCEKYGMAYFLHTNTSNFYKDTGTEDVVCYQDYSQEEKDSVKQNFLNTINKYAKHPAFAGIKFSDEHGIKEFPALKAATEIFKENYPDKIIYHNLLGCFASNAMMEYGPLFKKYNHITIDGLLKEGYSYYVEEFLKQVPVDYVSYDNYPIATSGIIPKWLNNLSIVTNLANKYNVAFWNFIQADKYDDSVLVPNEAEMQWQINTSLAYGVKSIQLFTFFCPVEFCKGETSGGIVNCISGTGEVNQLYYDTKKALQQIPLMQEVLMNSKWKGIMATETGIPACEVAQRDLLSEFNAVTGVKSTNSHVFVGCFNYQGKTALYVVNNSVMSPTNVILDFKVEVKGTMIKDNQKVEFTSKNQQLMIPYLVEGGAALVVID